MIEEFRNISIRGRMAYLLCSFEKLLLFYNYNRMDWKWILERLWAFTNVEYIDDWFYFMAEVLPNTILCDTPSDLEYITVQDFLKLKELYSNINSDVNDMLYIIYKLGSAELYTRIRANSIKTINILIEGINLLNTNGIELVNIEPFKIYSITEGNGWGARFEGKYLSVFLT